MTIKALCMTKIGPYIPGLLLLLKNYYYLLKNNKRANKNIFGIVILKCTFIAISTSMKDVFYPHDIFFDISFSLFLFFRHIMISV